MPQPGVHPVEIRHAIGPDTEHLETVKIFLAHMALEGLPLAFEQHAPGGVLLGTVALPALVDDALFDCLSRQKGVSGHRFHS
jgi:hypothetical protein